MEINKVSYSPNFQAKLIIADERVQKYVKSAFMANSKDTFNTLDKFSEIYPDSVVSINIKKHPNHVIFCILFFSIFISRFHHKIY